MEFKFIIPNEIENHNAVVYEGQYVDNNTIRVIFPMGGKITYTDYQPSDVAKKFSNKTWVAI